MKQRKYTLPRHTNLAKNSSRTGAFIIDLALFLGIALGLTFGVFSNIFKFKTTPLFNELKTEQLASSLFFEKDGEINYPTDETDNTEFEERLCKFYTVYLPDISARTGIEEIKNPQGEKIEYTIEWFNENVLGIRGENPDAETDTGLFTYYFLENPGGGGTYDKTVMGVPKATSAAQDVNIYLQKQLEPALNGIFYKIPSIYKIVSEYNFFYALSFVSSGIISAFLVYVVLPLFLKDGRTLGKKLFNLCLANSDGYKMHNTQLLMRVMPMSVLLLSGILPIYTDYFYIILACLVIFLVSFTLSMASPKRSSLHDFCARTIVVDAKSSILFENEMQEEAYLIKEDESYAAEKVDTGEEPELKYEK